MRLYHGTSARHLASIIDKGITPRGGGASNWTAASASGNVYLTNAYSIYFAQNARKEADEDLLVVEVDTDLLDIGLLQADEDAAWFAWRSGNLPSGFSPDQACDKYSEAMHFSGVLAELATEGFGYESSLELMGNCSHAGAVPTSAITKVLRYRAVGGPWWLMFHDPVISPQNFKFNGPEYVATQLVVADRLEEALEVPQLFPGFLDLRGIADLCVSKRTVEYEASPALRGVAQSLARRPA